MPRNRTALLTLALLLLIGLAACNLPGVAAPPTSFPSSQESYAQYTAAAQTIVAQLTLVSNPASPTPLDSTPTPTVEAATPTLPAETATDTPPEAEPSPLPPTETPTPESTATEAAPTITLPAGDPRAELGDPTWRDMFADGSNWYLYVDEDAAFEIKETGLVMTSYTTGTRNAWMLTQNQPLNFYLEVTAQAQECIGLDRYGVIVRSDSTTGYLFNFTCDGRYSFRKWNGARMTKLVEWTAKPSILVGPYQTNRMGIRIKGSQFSLYANGTLLNEVSDSSYIEGGFGVLVGADTTENYTVHVSEVAYWELP